MTSRLEGSSPRYQAQHIARWVGLLILIAALALYLWTLDDGLQPEELRGGDLITHQYAQVEARPSNAPGYPLYTMGGWLWFRLGRLLLGPYSNPIRILSSYSTLWALLALWLLYRLLLDVTEGNWALSGLCTAFYAVTYFFWYYATTTEQYTSAVAQTLLMIWLAFRWDAAQSRGEEGDRYLLALAFLTGIGLAHMVTVLFIVPPILWFVLARRSDLLRRPRLIMKAIGLLALPLLSYAYVYIRGAQHPEWRGVGEWESTWQWFWSFLSTRQGRDELTWSLSPLWTDEFPALIWRELTWPALLIGLWGISRLGRHRAALIYSSLAIYLVFCFIDRLGNWYQVIMPAYPLIVMGLAVAADALWRWGLLRRAWPTRAAILLFLCALVGYRFMLSLPGADSSGRPGDVGLDPGWRIIADDPPADATILGTLDERLALDYLTRIWGVRSDLRTISADQARGLLEGGHTFLSTVDAVPIVRSEVAPEARFSSAGVTLVEVRLTPRREPPALDILLQRPVGDGLTLLGISRRQPRVHPALPDRFHPAPRLTLYWQATKPISHDWAISLRPTRGSQFIFAGGQLVQTDRRHPVQGAYPTTRWVPGETVRDDYALPVIPGPPADGLAVIVYRPLPEGGFQNLAEVHIPGNPY
ncbi:MAG TPA: DUF2723 domain-containing protein [Caldilineae bacterium]|nr:DUF2723 domain-containing protein [Caldilineae bacterium]